jgi:hypothetical protein
LYPAAGHAFFYSSSYLCDHAASVVDHFFANDVIDNTDAPFVASEEKEEDKNEVFVENDAVDSTRTSLA